MRVNIMSIEELYDRTYIKELFDRVSVLGDKKDFHAQVQLFTENAVSESYAGGKQILKLEGRTEMEKGFKIFLSKIETVYHFNGQQIVDLDGDAAHGTCYCLITLIGNDGGQKTRTTIGAIYKDDYVRENSQWLIAKRRGIFDWQEKHNV